MDSKWFTIYYTVKWSSAEKHLQFFWLAGRMSASHVRVWPIPKHYSATKLSWYRNIYYDECILNSFSCWLCWFVFPSNEVCVLSEQPAMIHHIAVMTDRKAQIRHRFVRPTRRRWLVKVSASQVWLFGRRIGALKSFLQVSHCDSCWWNCVSGAPDDRQSCCLVVPPEHDTCTAESAWMEVNPPPTPPSPPPLSVSLSLAVVGHQSFVVETIVAAIKDGRWKQVSILTSVHLSSPLSLCLLVPLWFHIPPPCVNNEQRQPPVFTIKEKLTTSRTEKFKIAYVYLGIYK